MQDLKLGENLEVPQDMWTGKDLLEKIPKAQEAKSENKQL